MAGRALTFACAFAASFACGAGAPALADRVQHPTAVFAGLDKITGRIIAFEVAIDETVQFGSLQITPRVCYTRPLTEAPLTTGFVEVEEAVVTGPTEATDDKKFKRIFGGWMFAASPGLHGIEHAVYDAWLTDCKGGSKVVADSLAPAESEAEAKPTPAAAPRQRRQPAAPPAAQAAPQAAPQVAPQAAPRRAPPPASAQQQQPRRQPSQSFFPSPF